SPLTSNAALAAGQPKPLDPTHDLRIGSGPNAVPTGWQGNGGSGAVLERPQQLPEPGSGKELFATGNAVPAPPITSYEKTQAGLAARGVKWQRLEHIAASNEWRFTCSLPSRQNPNVNRTYEASAGDHIAAIQHVLDKIQAEQ